MDFLIVLITGGMITYAIRLSFILLHGKINLPGWFMHSLRYVPVAVLSSITISALANRNTQLEQGWQNPQFFAATLAVLVAWRTRNVFLTIISGLVSFWLIQMLFSHL